MQEEEDTATIQERHVSWCLTLAEQAWQQLRGRGGDRDETAACLSRVETEYDNLRVAQDRCATNTDDAQAGLRLAGALWPFCERRGYWSEGRARLEAALAREEGLDGTVAQIRARFSLGCVMSMQGELQAARRHLEQSLSVSREVGDDAWEGTILNTLGNVAIGQRELKTAREFLDQALAIRREQGDRIGAAASLSNLGMLAWVEGDLTAARPLFEQALATWREAGNRDMVSGGLTYLAMLARDAGDLTEARTFFEDALSIEREIGSLGPEALNLSGLGQVALAEGNPAAARVLFLQALAIRRKIGDRGIESQSLLELGIATHAEGDLTAAHAFYSQSLTLVRHGESVHRIIYRLEQFALLAVSAGDLQRAVCLAGAAQAALDPPEMLLEWLPPEQKQPHERLLAVASVALGADAFILAWNTGQAMTRDEAVDYALQNPPRIA